MATVIAEYVDEQTLWAFVREVGTERGLGDGNLAKLRFWAAENARDRRYRVFDREKGGMVRKSFRTALGHAADELMAGREAE